MSAQYDRIEERSVLVVVMREPFGGEFALNEESLQIRIANLRRQGLDVSEELRAAADLATRLAARDESAR